MRTTKKVLKTIFSAQAANASGTTIDVRDVKHITLQFSAYGTPTFTIKFQGSISDTAPTFSSAQSETNHWDYVNVVDLQDGGNIAGDTGISPAGTNDFRNLVVNTENLNWINATISSRSGGSCDLKASKADNG